MNYTLEASPMTSHARRRIVWHVTSDLLSLAYSKRLDSARMGHVLSASGMSGKRSWSSCSQAAREDDPDCLCLGGAARLRSRRLSCVLKTSRLTAQMVLAIGDRLKTRTFNGSWWSQERRRAREFTEQSRRNCGKLLTVAMVVLVRLWW